ncbi:DNA polymerase III subunit delta [Helicobacter mehlei]|uniref:DNA polymerase III subunit delta n=1 Tax=Helicobacter mehlei TaxID=2316080 RepID=UPI00163DE420|nr:DNA polymerase III [Helicobacter mehlei]
MKRATPRAALLYGEWAFYIEYYARKIAKAYSQAQKSQFDFGDYRFQEVLEVLSQDSLFATGNLVCLRLDKKLGAKEIRALLDTLALHPRNALIIEFYQAKDKSTYAQDFKQFATQFKHPKLGDHIIDVRFFMPNLDTLLELLQEKVHALGLIIDTQALLLLLEVQNNDVRIIYQDLEKLALLDKPIGITEVQEHVYGLMGAETQELLEALFEKPKKVFESFARLQGVEEMELIWGLERYFYQLFLIFAYLKGHNSMDAKEILGFNPPPMVLKQLSQRAQQVQDYQGVFGGLRTWHIASMQGQKDAGWHFLIKVQDYIR